ncbi:hypothetical protein HV437_14725 [Bacillus sporothermodurans]|nr:hypothetical protein [Heyndrickxia sporothermodurans]MBL5858173.1 hypothetical protein [Heyndrickxia sporothermodurans]MBL5871094.1 hypothetical protein [Heyndrickxia sporothermodurans]
MQIDTIDKKIIDELSKNSRLSVNVNPKVDHVAHVKVDHPFVTSNMFL